MAYIKDIKYTTIDISKAYAIYIQFGISSISFIRSILIQTPIRHIKFHIIKVDIPFLLCFVDIDWLGSYFNNIDNSPVMKSILILIIRHFDHLFLLWENCLTFFITQFFDHNLCYFIETELYQLLRCFEHSFAMKLCLLFERSGYKINKPAFDRLTKYCSICQKHGKSPGSFKFTLRDDVTFNYLVFVNIIYIDNSLILYLIEKAIRY